METPNLDQITNLAARQKADSQGFLAGQAGQQSDYLNKYTNFINSQEGASAMATRIGNELGLPQLQKGAIDLRNLYTNLPQTYSKATTGYDVNANQLNRIVGQKSSELAPMVDTAERSLAGAQNVLGQRMGYEQADQARAEKPYAVEQSMLADRQAREASFYTADNQRELDALINKVQMGVTLSEGEKNRAATLAASEKQYELEKQKMSSTTPNTQIVESNGKKLLIDSGTGKVISSYGTSNSTGPVNTSAYYPANYYGSSNGKAVQSTSSYPSYFTPAK